MRYPGCVTEAENPFSHPIAGFILTQVSFEETGQGASLEDEALDAIRKRAFLLVDKEDHADAMADALIEVVDFLEKHGAIEIAKKIAAISEDVEDALAPEEEGAGGETKKAAAAKAGGQFEGFDDDDEVEPTRGRRAAAKLMDKSTVKRAPQMNDDNKPDGSISLQSLIGTKRRM